MADPIAKGLNELLKSKGLPVSFESDDQVLSFIGMYGGGGDDVDDAVRENYRSVIQQMRRGRPQESALPSMADLRIPPPSPNRPDNYGRTLQDIRNRRIFEPTTGGAENPSQPVLPPPPIVRSRRAMPAPQEVSPSKGRRVWATEYGEAPELPPARRVSAAKIIVWVAFALIAAYYELANLYEEEPQEEPIFDRFDNDYSEYDPFSKNISAEAPPQKAQAKRSKKQRMVVSSSASGYVFE